METTWRFKVDDSDVEQSMLRHAELVEKTDADYRQLEKDATEALQAIADNTATTSKKLDQYADQVEKTTKKTKEAEQEPDQSWAPVSVQGGPTALRVQLVGQRCGRLMPLPS